MRTNEERLMAAVTKFRRKDKEQQEPTTWSKKLEGMPVECRFTPLDDRKRPVDPATGHLRKEWQQIGYEAHELDAFNGHVKGVGLMVGEMSDGIAALDFDGPGSEQTFEKHIGRSASELPDTVAWTSGIPGRYQAAYRIPKKWWGRISAKMLKEPGCGDCELRWNHQSAIADRQCFPDRFIIGRIPVERLFGLLDGVEDELIQLLPDQFLIRRQALV